MSKYNSISRALEVRKAAGLYPCECTTCWRLVHGEGDSLPGLIIDWYDGVCVMQAHSVGMFRSKKNICQALVRIFGDSLKAVYDKEITEKKAALDAQRAVVAQKAAGIDPRLMEEYNVIKKHIMPPMARLVGNQCSGCNTAQPSSLLSKIKSGAEIVECETCGRMIIQ